MSRTLLKLKGLTYFSQTMKKYIVKLLVMVPFWAFCQEAKVVFEQSIPITADTFSGRDGFGNYFYLKNEVFHKKSDKKEVQYANFSLGTPSKIDLINTLKTTLFYEKFNTVVLLDNQLNEIQKIDLSKATTPIIASYAGLSSLNSLWIYNTINQQLLLYNFQLNTIKNIGNPFVETPLYYQSNFNYFYWINSQNELFSMSIFGDIAALGKIQKGDSYQIINDQELMICRSNSFYIFDLKTKKEHKMFDVEKSFKNFYYKDQILSIFTNEEITNYKIILP